MAVRFHELPLDVFGEEARPFIARLNVELRELFALEGALANPLSTKRSDDTIARRDTEQVHVTRITPDVSTVVSGASTVVGTPALTFSTVNTVGSTTSAVSTNSTIALFGATATQQVGVSSVGSGGWAARGDHSHGISMSAVVGSTAPMALAGTSSGGTAEWASRGDHVHIFPQTLQSASGGTDSITLTQVGTDLTLTTTNSGLLSIELAGIGLDISGDSSPSQVVSISGDFDNNNTLLKSSWSGGSLTNKTVRCWDASYSAVSGAWSGSTIIGFDTVTFSLAPTATGSSQDNKAYCARLAGPVVSNSNGGYTEIATAYLSKPSRAVTANPPISLAATLLLEPPTISGNTQAGILIRQGTAQIAASNRYGIFIDAQNSGTVRHSIYGVSDLAKFTGPLVVGGEFGVTGLATFGNSITVTGNIDHNGTAVGLYGTTPTTQYSTTGTVTGHSVTTGTTVTATDVFTGNTGSTAYTISDVVRALKIIGAIAY